MAKFRVHFESSAAVGIEVAVEAENEEAAQAVAQRLFDEKKLDLQSIVDSLMSVSDDVLNGWNSMSDGALPVTHAAIELDEAGFEIVDAFDEKIVSAA